MLTIAEMTGIEADAPPQPDIDHEFPPNDSDVRDIDARTSYIYNQDPQTKQHIHFETGM